MIVTIWSIITNFGPIEDNSGNKVGNAKLTSIVKIPPIIDRIIPVFFEMDFTSIKSLICIK